MRMKIIIDRLKAQCPTLGGRVSGMSDFLMAADREEALGTTHAFVIRLTSEVLPNDQVGGVSQVFTERFGVFVCVNAAADRRGYDADDQFDDIRTELRAALVNWSPDGTRSPFEDDGFENVTATRARAWRRFDFATLLCE